MEVPRTLLLNSLFLSKIFICKQKLLVKNLGTPTVKVYQLSIFEYLLYMAGAMPPNDRSPILLKKNRIEPKDIRTKFV